MDLETLERQRAEGARVPVTVNPYDPTGKEPERAALLAPVVRELTSATEAAGLTREDVARAVGVDGWRVTSWQRGDRAPELADVSAWARLLGRQLTVGLL